MTTSDEFDYVIVGAGSAGCVLADRLSADGRHRVCVLEFGGSDRSMLIQMPAALSIPLNMPKYSWAYRTEPEPHLGGRRITCPRGKVLGGSSSINGLVYVRGNPLDFDGWEGLGAAGWGYRHVLPYFRRAESRQEERTIIRRRHSLFCFGPSPSNHCLLQAGDAVLSGHQPPPMVLTSTASMSIRTSSSHESTSRCPYGNSATASRQNCECLFIPAILPSESPRDISCPL
jgi:choline dehydrogenase-like flavoprotein